MGVKLESREAAKECSPRRKPWVECRDDASPRGGEMFFLAGDIFHHRRDIRFADAENSVACLPFKIWAPFFANPTRGICFYDAGKFGRSLCLASLEQCHLDRRTVQIEIQFRSEGGVREC